MKKALPRGVENKRLEKKPRPTEIGPTSGIAQVPTGDDAFAVNGYLARLEQEQNEEKIRHELREVFIEHSFKD